MSRFWESNPFELIKWITIYRCRRRLYLHRRDWTILHPWGVLWPEKLLFTLTMSASWRVTTKPTYKNINPASCFWHMKKWAAESLWGMLEVRSDQSRLQSAASWHGSLTKGYIHIIGFLFKNDTLSASTQAFQLSCRKEICTHTTPQTSMG